MLATRCSGFGPSSNRTPSKLLLVSGPRITFHFLKRHVARPGCNLVDAATIVGKLRAAGGAQSVERAAPRQSGFITPNAKLRTQVGAPVWPGRQGTSKVG